MDNLLYQIDSLTAMRIYQKLLNKGFQRVIYKEQEKPNIWYRIEFIDENLIKKYLEILKEDQGYWDYRFDNMKISIEIKENLNYSQYLITEQKLDFGGEAWGELTIKEFEKILDTFEDVNILC